MIRSVTRIASSSGAARNSGFNAPVALAIWFFSRVRVWKMCTIGAPKVSRSARGSAEGQEWECSLL